MSGIRGFAARATLGLELASLLWNAGEQVYLVGLLVLGHRAAGGLGVAAVGILQAVPSVVLLPIALRMTAGQPADRLLRGLVGVRIVAIGAAAALVQTAAPFAAVLAAVGVDALAGALARPARSVLIPAIARSPRELVSANVSVSAGRSLAGLLGPALATVLIVWPGGAAPFWVGAVLFASSLVLMVGVHGAAPLPTQAPAAGPNRGTAAKSAGPIGHARLIVGLVVGEQLVRGMLPVLIVGLALGPLAAGDQAVGILNSAIGLGGIVGGVLSIALVRRARVAPAFVAAVAVWGAGIAIPGVAPTLVLAVVGLALAGVGRSVIEVASVTLLQRTVPVADRASVFGRLESLAVVALAVGAIGGALLVSAGGPATAMVLAGILPILFALGTWRALRSADESVSVPEREIELLRAAPMLRPLPLTTIEELASAMRRVEVRAGEAVVRQGEPGEAFFVIEAGSLEVSIDGRVVRTLGAGASFGEIALLRDTPRTATVTAVTPSTLAALDREPFLAAVLGRHDAAAAAQDVIRDHLGG